VRQSRLAAAKCAVYKAIQLVDVKKPQSIPGEIKSRRKILVYKALFCLSSCGSIRTRIGTRALRASPDDIFLDTYAILGEKLDA